MPELPEVESAVRRLRAAAVGKTVERADILHRALRRRLPTSKLRTVKGATITSVQRRGKHQLMALDDGRTLHAHFRMTGDWHFDRTSDPLPRFARATIHFTDGSRVVLNDPRALSTLDLHAAGTPLDLGLGPEPSDPELTASSLSAVLSKRRGPIKPVLLDQRVIAGLGNIYAAEALWEARIAPTTSASSLNLRQTRALLAAVRKTIDRATGVRYTESRAQPLKVYDREGEPCRRCGAPVARVVQAGRSTYYCPGCQVG